ncbi:phenylacetaldoxime dehydratase family protein [Hansschlegelia plantiphila]|uniref:Phenylacetaldoxime dehydratase n=1 Tax=Hansschlegelia plantiphila TaxID=374655 RepID=A0A9W6J467_9HYPH|nr:phenylacetaldoxime dehydratase family protein [Hansschlegelia plantiphila]GLK68930.1 phenylacetaldoxime dehydratase [Hansschlegelia plantiphila]
MDSAIAPHLRCPRTRPRGVGDGHVPPAPAWSARAQEPLGQAVIGYFGVQFRSDDAPAARTAFEALLDCLNAADGPARRDLAQYDDAAGFQNLIAVSYWDAPSSYARWRDSARVAGWWDAARRAPGPLGYFREVLSPSAERLETIFSSDQRLEGLGALMGGVSDEIEEHGYWGSMRDRLPLAQTDGLDGDGALVPTTDPDGRGRRVAGGRNLVVIRSGQDWSETRGDERRLYLDDIEPTLRAGMDYLRDRGLEAGCFCNRYVQMIDETLRPIEKSFGVSHWRSLADLEQWSASHPTHLAIFGVFMQVVSDLKDLKLHHEVCVLEPAAQDYEYVNCHPGTGLLGAIG